MSSPESGAKTFEAYQSLAMNSSSSSSTGSSGSSGSSTGSSGSSASSSAAAMASSMPAAAGEGAKPMVDMALLLSVGVAGLYFIGL